MKIFRPDVIIEKNVICHGCSAVCAWLWYKAEVMMVGRSEPQTTAAAECGRIDGGAATKPKNIIGTAVSYLLCLLGIVFIVVVFIGLSLKYLGTSTQKPDDDIEGNLSGWMSIIEDGVYLSEVAIPGAHDAATAGMSWMAETQVNSVGSLLRLGVRYLDLRLALVEGRLVVFHGAETGTNDGELILKEIADFLVQNPSECVLLDFQHFKNSSEDRVLEAVRRELLDRDLLICNEMEAVADCDFVAGLKLRDCRGKAIAFWGNRDEKYLSETFLFGRNDDLCTVEGMSLNSKYIGSVSRMDSEEFLETGIGAYLDAAHRAAMKDETGAVIGKPIFVLQCQLTDKLLVRGPWSRHKTHAANMNRFIETLPGQDNLSMVNVVLEDFLNVESSKSVIMLNFYKKNIHPDNTAAFYDVVYGPDEEQAGGQ